MITENLTRYPHQFGTASRAYMVGVKQPLIDIAELAITLCEYDGTVLHGGGMRTLEQARENVKNGTGILASRHLTGDALDLIALTKGRLDWKNLDAFRAMAKAVKTASAILSIPIRQGCDWNLNGTFGESREWDWPHFELPSPKWEKLARAEMMRFRVELGLEDRT